MDTWDIFIAYHGSYDDNGSKMKAQQISTWLKSKGIRAYFFCDDPTDRFGDTPTMASYSTLFLLVANQNIPVNVNGEVSSVGVKSELRAFYNKKVYSYSGRQTLARVYCYDKCTPLQANDFHIMFNNVDHFEEGRDGEKQTLKKLYDWIVSVKNEGQKELFCASNLQHISFFDLNFSDRFLQLSPSNQPESIQMMTELAEIYSLKVLGKYIAAAEEKSDIIIAKMPAQWSGFNLLRFCDKNSLQNVKHIVFCRENSKGIIYYDIDKLETYSAGNEIGFTFNNCSIKLSNQTYNLSVTLNNEEEIPLYVFQSYDSDISYKKYSLEDNRLEETDELFTYQKDWTIAIEDYFFHIENKEKYFVTGHLLDIEDDMIDAIRKGCHNINSCKRFYNHFRATARLGSFSEIDEPAYQEVVRSISDFCQRKDPSKLRQTLSSLWILYENATGYYEKENLLLLVSEIVLYNTFALGEDYIKKYDLFDRLLKQIETEIIPQNRIRCVAYCCSMAKEILFGGDYRQFAPTFRDACKYVLSRYESLIGLFEEIYKRCDENNIDDELYRIITFTYRQRAVIWEELGDEELKPEAQKDFYRRWQEDSLKAIELSQKRATTDREIEGCAYLNYASTLVRFSVYETDAESKKELLSSCLENLTKAERLLSGISIQRLIGYVYYHRADCLDSLSQLFPAEQNIYDAQLRSMAVKADIIFKKTDDFNARGGVLRLLARCKMKSIENSVEKATECLNDFRSSLQFSLKAYNTNVMLKCIFDLTHFMHIIKEKDMMPLMYKNFKELFADELIAFATVIRQTDVNTDKIFDIQEALYDIYLQKSQSNE